MNLERVGRFALPRGLGPRELGEEYRKRIYLFIGFTLGIPVLVGYGLDYWLRRDEGMLPAASNFSLAVLFLVIAVLLRRTINGRILYRCGVGGFTVLLLENTVLGWHGGAGIFWLFVYPLVAFYLFDTREGVAWTAVTLIPSMVVVLAPNLFHTYEYPPLLRMPLTLSLLLVTALAFLLESLRAHFVRELEIQRSDLEHALANIKSLRGLLPICASCKRIRNNKGYWQAVEDYIRAHSDAEFSHGMCDSCLQQFHPEVYDRMLAEGKISGVDLTNGLEDD